VRLAVLIACALWASAYLSRRAAWMNSTSALFLAITPSFF